DGAKRPRRQWVYQGVALLAGLIGLVAYWADRMLVMFLVHLAICGVEVAQPSGAYPPEINVSTKVRADRYLDGTTAALPLVIVNLALTAALVSTWKRPRLRLLVGTLWLAGLASEGALSIWLSDAGLRQLSPTLHQARQVHVASFAIVGATAIVAVLTFAWR